jgi:hypothetical protein
MMLANEVPDTICRDAVFPFAGQSVCIDEADERLCLHPPDAFAGKRAGRWIEGVEIATI